MTTNGATHPRELTGDEVVSVAGGIIGAIAGYRPPPLPQGLFVCGSTCVTRDGVPGGTCWNNYAGESGWTF